MDRRRLHIGVSRRRAGLVIETVSPRKFEPYSSLKLLLKPVCSVPLIAPDLRVNATFAVGTTAAVVAAVVVFFAVVLAAFVVAWPFVVACNLEVSVVIVVLDTLVVTLAGADDVLLLSPVVVVVVVVVVVLARARVLKRVVVVEAPVHLTRLPETMQVWKSLSVQSRHAHALQYANCLTLDIFGDAQQSPPSQEQKALLLPSSQTPVEM